MNNENNQNIDTTTEIWDILYLVRVPYLETTSVEYIRQFGMPTSGNKAIDGEMSRQLITTYLPIAQLVEYYKDGVNIYIVNPSDPKKIYEAISRHIEAWKSQLRYGINIGDAPIEDLMAMDKFANAIYEHAKYHMVDDNTNSPLAEALKKFSMFGGSGLFRKTTLPSEVNKVPDIIRINQKDNLPKRESLSEFFKTSLNTTNRFRG